MAAARILSALDYAVLARNEDCSFSILGTAPSWFRVLLPAEFLPLTMSNLAEIFPFLEEFVEECEEFWRAKDPGRIESDLWTQFDRQGSERHLQASAIHADGQPWLLIERVDARYEARLAIQQNAHEMELLSVQLEFAMRAKTDFIATLSHEMRTPLNAILGFADLLAGSKLESEDREYVEVLQSEGENLLTLLNDSLDLSKVDAGRLELESIPFSLDQVLSDAARTMAMRAYMKGLEVVCWADSAVPDALQGDPHRLRQVLLNLLSNAVKFTESGEVTVHVTLAEEGLLEFAVRDSGMGIAASKLDLIFRDFTQADPSITRKYGGTGLGLGISRRLVQQMGGQIWVESSPGEGSTFRFSAKLPSSSQPAAPLPDFDLSGMNILIADPNHSNRRMLRDLLESWRAVVTEDRSRPYDLALVDSRQLLASVPRTVPIILPHRAASDIRRCRKLGWNTCIAKPLRKSDIRSQIQSAISPALPSSRLPPSPCPPSFASLRILIADDSSANILLLKSYLKGTGCHVDIAENGFLAVEKFLASSYDLVLTDVQMPVLDGYAATARMREWEKEHRKLQTPILALTASSAAEEAERSAQAGCTAFLLKPIRRADLLDAIDRHAGHATLVSADPGIAELVAWYLDSWNHKVPTLLEMLENSDYDSIRLIGHNLRGTGSGYGFPELSSVGELLENAAMENDDAAVRIALERLAAQLDQVSRRPKV